MPYVDIVLFRLNSTKNHEMHYHNACKVFISLLYPLILFVTINLSNSNLGLALLGHCLVEHFFPEMTYEEYVTLNILEPLELTNTGFNITERCIILIYVIQHPV